MHVIRVELTVRYVMANVVPCSNNFPFLHWFRFEWGTGGNPHAHGVAYVEGNPTFESIVADEDTKRELIAHGHAEAFLC